MRTGRGRPLRRRLRAMLVAATIAAISASGAVLMLPSAASANTITNFCGGFYGGGAYCNQGHSHSIWWIEALASADAFCVYRATEGWAGAPSASGKEYCASTESGGYVFQEFFGLTGYAATHNRHSYTVEASPAFEYS
jgi:hypothetical protein